MLLDGGGQTDAKNDATPNKEERLLALPLLRTVRESFPSYRSSLS
ncbi:MAG: hypothetical protein ACT6FG_04865 [Methanosarcinaceae archaeon]